MISLFFGACYCDIVGWVSGRATGIQYVVLQLVVTKVLFL